MGDPYSEGLQELPWLGVSILKATCAPHNTHCDSLKRSSNI